MDEYPWKIIGIVRTKSWRLVYYFGNVPEKLRGSFLNQDYVYLGNKRTYFGHEYDFIICTDIIKIQLIQINTFEMFWVAKPNNILFVCLNTYIL